MEYEGWMNLYLTRQDTSEVSNAIPRRFMQYYKYIILEKNFKQKIQPEQPILKKTFWQRESEWEQWIQEKAEARRKKHPITYIVATTFIGHLIGFLIKMLGILLGF